MPLEEFTVKMDYAYVDEVKARFLAEVGDPNYDWRYDPSQDGIINTMDIAWINAHWGKTVTIRKWVGELTYRNTIEWEAETTNEFASKECKTLGATCEPTWDVNIDEVRQKIIEAIPEAIRQELKTRAEKEGYVFRDVGITNVEVDFTYRTARRQFRDYTMIRKYAKANIRATITFDSDKPIAESPIAISFSAIIAIIAGIILTAFAIHKLFEWLKSMTTKKYTVHTIKYDEYGNIIEETWEEGEEPSIIGIAGVGSIVIILAVILFVFMFLRGRK